MFFLGMIPKLVRCGRDEQPSWTREQPVLPAEVVAPPLLSRGQVSLKVPKMEFFIKADI